MLRVIILHDNIVINTYVHKVEEEEEEEEEQDEINKGINIQLPSGSYLEIHDVIYAPTSLGNLLVFADV
jgi:hypothetical protein